MRVSLLLMRLGLGVLFFYAGITKVLNPKWTAAGYLQGAQTFRGFYAWLASPANIGWVNFMNEWGLTLLGLSLFFGLLVRFSAPLGALIMALYYLPSLNFPYVGQHYFLVDEHVIFILCLALLYFTRAGEYFGLDKYVRFRR